jgi:hypothetical protein
MNVVVNDVKAIWVGEAAGDMDYYSNPTTKARLVSSAEGDGIVWRSGVPVCTTRPWAINLPLGNAANVIETGLKHVIEIPVACYIDAVRLVSANGESGSIVVNIWKKSYADLPATVTDKITASAPPTITTSTKSEDTTLTGWTRSIAAGDWLYIIVDSVTTFKTVILSISGHQL